MTIPVSVLCELPRHTARNDSRSRFLKVTVSPLKTPRRVPSEGRGRGFEFLWVRQHSQRLGEASRAAQNRFVQRSVSASSICSRCVHGVGL
jgi:hypothetical protein